MDWITSVQMGIDYIETHILEELDYSEISNAACSSCFHFQRVFSILCGFTIGEYIRYRRLSLAAKDLIENKSRIIDIALKYRYDTPESFTKAFTRFHGLTPISVRKSSKNLKYFEPLFIQIHIEGGNIKDYSINKKIEERASEIQTFDNINIVRKYPKTFLGSTSKNGVHHMLYEVLTCSINEAIEGHCNNINLIIKPEDVIEINDNGRCILTAIDRKTGITVLESIFTTIRDKDENTKPPISFDSFAPVCLGIINALSEWLEVEVMDGKDTKFIRFERGIKTIDLHNTGKTKCTGSVIRFKPDSEIFSDTSVDYAEIHSIISTQASRYTEYHINITDQRNYSCKSKSKI